MKIKSFFLLSSLLFVLLFVSACSNTPTGNVALEDEYVRIPVEDISNNMIKLSHYEDGVKINYFLVKGSDGEVRTAFDACDVCGGYKGYTQNGGDVVCNNCGRVFNIDDIGVLNSPGGCWPSKLTHKIENGEVLISKSELGQGKWRFA